MHEIPLKILFNSVPEPQQVLEPDAPIRSDGLWSKFMSLARWKRLLTLIHIIHLVTWACLHHLLSLNESSWSSRISSVRLHLAGFFPDACSHGGGNGPCLAFMLLGSIMLLHLTLKSL